MDDIASALVSLVGLIGQFKSGRDSTKAQDFDDFMQLLADSNHAELKSLIESNHATAVSIKAILNQQNDVVRSSLAQIDSQLAGLVSAINGFSDLAQSIHPKQVLSDQAISFLEVADSLEDGRIELFRAVSGPQLRYVSGTRPKNAVPARIPDPKFIEGDFELMVEHGYFSSAGREGITIYTITRRGAEFVKQLKLAKSALNALAE
ncbi:hypothetical protein [Pseudomonas nitroreducens]|uniref:hypothetical protein n=1 Tax=Pseudomonas nitroreducens TaxID=46680 RepID=UPI003D287173